jgi:hypothetical protein
MIGFLILFKILNVFLLAVISPGPDFIQRTV